MKKAFGLLSALLPAVLSVAALGYDLYTYAPHYEGGAGLISLICLIVCLTGFVRTARRRQKRMFVWLLSLAICTGALILAEQIPFCPECDQVSREDLGILRHWINAGWWK